jgi:hypothetical protein
MDLYAVFDGPGILNAEELSLGPDNSRRKLDSEPRVRAVIFGNDERVAHDQSMGHDHQ